MRMMIFTIPQNQVREKSITREIFHTNTHIFRDGHLVFGEYSELVVERWVLGLDIGNIVVQRLP
jgi:hypothetical protein